MKIQLPILLGLTTAAVLTLGLGVLPASATDGLVVGATQNGDGAISFLDPATGEVTTPAIPMEAEFAGTVGDGLSNISGLAFSPVDNVLYALNYSCEVITIDTTTGESTTVVTAPTGYLGAEPDCEGLAVTSTGDILVSMRTTVKKLNVGTGAYEDLATAPLFSNATWLAFEPLSGLVYAGDYVSSNMVVKTFNPDGSSQNTVGNDPNFVSSVAFDNGGNAIAGYWGSGYFTGSSSTFPEGMTASTASALDNAYWVAAEFLGSATPEPSSPDVLAETGIDLTWSLGMVLALGLTGALAVLFQRRRHS